MQSFTAIDFETANGSRASICSVGLVKVSNSAIVDSFYSLVIPPSSNKEFAYYNVLVHGITAQDVKNAPTWAELFLDIESFISGDVLVAHNAPFDSSCLKQSNEIIGAPTQYQWRCTLKSSRRLLPNLPNYKLPTVADALAVRLESHHNALDDASTAAAIAIELSRLGRLE